MLGIERSWHNKVTQCRWEEMPKTARSLKTLGHKKPSRSSVWRARPASGQQTILLRRKKSSKKLSAIEPSFISRTKINGKLILLNYKQALLNLLQTGPRPSPHQITETTVSLPPQPQASKIQRFKDHSSVEPAPLPPAFRRQTMAGNIGNIGEPVMSGALPDILQKPLPTTEERNSTNGSIIPLQNALARYSPTRI